MNNVLYSNNVCIKRNSEITAVNAADGSERGHNNSMTPEEKVQFFANCCI